MLYLILTGREHYVPTFRLITEDYNAARQLAESYIPDLFNFDYVAIYQIIPNHSIEQVFHARGARK